MTREQAFRRVEEEIRQAQAEALGRTGERLADLLERLARLDRELAGAAEDGRASREVLRGRIEARDRLRDDAARVRDGLIIQREALGLVRHTLVEQHYPIPARWPRAARSPG